jgi:lipoprotein NlpD
MGRGLRYRIIILCVTLLIGGCGELTPPGERREEIGRYTVRPGDTLYSIAWGKGLDHRELAAWNEISPPYLIHPGQQLSLTPPLARRVPPPSSQTSQTTDKSSARSAARPPKAIPKASSKRGSLAKQSRPKTTKKVGEEKKMRTSSLSGVENNDNASKITSSWRWPAIGKVVAKFDADSGKKGIDITGMSGQPIFSAAAGDVVYSGNGLLGYGNLIIIKHDDIYLSAYGHNSQLLVKEGDKVTSGQEIAKMGVSPKEGATLHFEIRKEGKPVDPQRYLPKKN